jgi:hypothetical protein
MRQAMTNKRNRKRAAPFFRERLIKFAQGVFAAAKLPRGAERSELLLKVRDREAVVRIERWVSSPGLRSPK